MALVLGTRGVAPRPDCTSERKQLDGGCKMIDVHNHSHASPASAPPPPTARDAEREYKGQGQGHANPICCFFSQPKHSNRVLWPCPLRFSAADLLSVGPQLNPQNRTAQLGTAAQPGQVVSLPPTNAARTKVTQDVATYPPSAQVCIDFLPSASHTHTHEQRSACRHSDIPL